MLSLTFISYGHPEGDICDLAISKEDADTFCKFFGYYEYASVSETAKYVKPGLPRRVWRIIAKLCSTTLFFVPEERVMREAAKAGISAADCKRTLSELIYGGKIWHPKPEHCSIVLNRTLHKEDCYPTISKAELRRIWRTAKQGISARK